MSTLRLKPFQREDLARAALKDGAILSWEMGLGKSIAAYAWPIIKEARRVLIVAPAGLHRQLRETGWQFFGQHPHSIETEQDCLTFRLNKPPRGTKTEFFLISYQALGMNGADEWAPEIDKNTGELSIPRDIRNSRKKLAGLERYNHERFAGIGETRGGITCVLKPCLARLFDAWGTFDCVVVDEGTKLQATESCISQGVRMLNQIGRAHV